MNLKNVILVFLIVIHNGFSQVEYNISYQTFAPYQNVPNYIAAYGDGYVIDGVYFEPQNGYSNNIIPGHGCSGSINGKSTNLAVTQDASFYCLEDSDNAISLNKIDPSDSEIIKSYSYSGNNTAYLLTSGNYIILAGYDLGSNLFSGDVFDTSTEKFICHVQNIDAGSKMYFTVVAMTPDALILISQDLSDFQKSSYYYYSCSTGDYVITHAPSNYSWQQAWAFNKSSIFASIGSDVKQTYSMQTFTFDLTGTARFGSIKEFGLYLEASKLSKVNDTSFLIPSFTASNEFMLNIEFYVINPMLQIQEVEVHYTGFAISPYAFENVIIGTTSVSIYDNAAFFYDFENRTIIDAWTALQPIIMSNNSVVNLTDGGYLIQSPGEPIYFINAPVLSGNILSSDFNDVWSFYTPEYIPNIGYKICTLTRFQINTSTITQYSFRNCPVNQLHDRSDLNLEQVYFEEGSPSPFVVYTSTFAYLVIVNTTDVVFEKVLDIYRPGEVYVNFTTQFVTIIRNDDAFVQAYKINMTSGSITNYLNISNSTYSGSARMNDNYYMVGGSLNSTYSFFDVVDVNSLEIVRHITIKIPFTRTEYLVNPFFVMGTDSQSSNFSLIVFSSGDNPVQLITENGQIIELNFYGLPPSFQSLIDENNFLAVFTDGTYFFSEFINVVYL